MSWTDYIPETPVNKSPGWWAFFGISPVGIPSAEVFGSIKVAKSQKIIASGIPSAEAFGELTVVYHQTINPIGIDSEEAFGGSGLDPGGVNISALGIPSAESFGEPFVFPGTAFLFTEGISSGEAFGEQVISTGPVDVFPFGISSGETFGNSEISYIIKPSGIVSEEAFGAIFLSRNIKPAGISSAEAFGTPNVIGPPQAITPTGIISEEAFGGSEVNPGPINLQLIGISSEVEFGVPAISVGSVNISIPGIISAETFGTARLSQKIIASGIASQETFGAAKVNRNIFVPGITSAEIFGVPTLDFSSIPVQFDALTFPADAIGNQSWTDSSTAGSVIIVDIVLVAANNNDATSCTVNGSPMTRVGSIYCNNIPNGNPARLIRYVYEDSPGTPTIAITKSGFQWISSYAISYKNVGSVGATTSAYGGGANLSHGPISGSGMTVQAFASGNGGSAPPTLSNLTGGTLRRNYRGAVNTPVISTMDSIDTTVFEGQFSSSFVWASLATVLNAM